MKLCATCRAPLWMIWLLFGWPWKRRIKPFSEARDCVDLLPYDWDQQP